MNAMDIKKKMRKFDISIGQSILYLHILCLYTIIHTSIKWRMENHFIDGSVLMKAIIAKSLKC